ncbi:hypothetical protein BVIR_1736 [Blastochloris viridis]|uniref:Uncharacterized protein n=1 Tax=Blastochloris viridis TaxID=1079 RepID=A0A0P0JJV4_BLAVI|nr:hypothetical protein BVIR_1736 [Blastochloris viridis]CUU42174.1 hypothetical protein BVIRIDIS_11810 [Blastochloris viridis]
MTAAFESAPRINLLSFGKHASYCIKRLYLQIFSRLIIKYAVQMLDYRTIKES